MAEKITPTCKYGHGDLSSVPTDSGLLKDWTLMTADCSRLFKLRLYVCGICGSAEIFDPGAMDGTNEEIAPA